MRQVNPVNWGQDSRPFLTLEDSEHFEMRKKAAQVGLAYCEFQHPTNPRYRVYRLLPLAECREVGADFYHGEKYPRYAEVA